MPTVYKRPGVFVEEVTLPQRVVSQASDISYGAFVGVAERGSSGDPVFVSSWADYSQKFGGFVSPAGNSLQLPHAVYQYFANGGRGCYVKRVVSTDGTTPARKATVTLQNSSTDVLIVNAISEGDWAISSPTGLGVSVFVENTTQSVASASFSVSSGIATIVTATPHNFVASQKVAVSGMTTTGLNGTQTLTSVTATSISFATSVSTTSSTADTGGTVKGVPQTFNLSVYYNGTTSGYLVERYTDLNLDPSSSRYALPIVNGSSSWINLSVTGITNTSFLAPTTSTVAQGLAKPSGISDSLDGATVTAAEIAAVTTSFDNVLQNLVFNIPDAASLSSDTNARTVINAFISYADSRGDSFVVVDTPANKTVSDAVTFVGSITPKSGNAAVYYPWITVPDPSGSGSATKTIAPGGAVVGLMIANDAINGTYRSPAGVRASLGTVLATERVLTSANLDTLNSNNYAINAIRSIPGSGVCVMGARTISANRADRYVSARRTLLQVKKKLSDLTQFALFESNNSVLRERVRTVCVIYLNSLWQAGGLKGANPSQAFYVLCNSTNNPVEDVDNGLLTIEVGVALQTPAEFVVIRVGQFNGTTTVSIEE